MSETVKKTINKNVNNEDKKPDMSDLNKFNEMFIKWLDEQDKDLRFCNIDYNNVIVSD